jgi:hypothetical protein
MATADASTEPTHERAPWLIGLSLLALAAFGLRAIANADFWIHLATGRVILESGLPKADPFSFTTFADRLWINPSWLYDLGLYLVWRVGAAPLTILLHVAAMVGGIVLLLPLARRLGSDTAVAGAVLISAWLIAPAFNVSPAPWVILILGMYVRALGRGLPSLSARVLLCGLQVAWTNMHSSFLLGPLLMLLFAAEHAGAARERTGSRSAGSRAMRSGMIFAGLLLLLTCLNPYLFGLHRYVMSTVRKPDLALQFPPPFEADFQPFMGRWAGIACLILIFGGLILVKGRLPIAATLMAVMGGVGLVIEPSTFVFTATLAAPFMALSIDTLASAVADIRRGPLDHTSPLRQVGYGLASILALGSICMAASNYYYGRIGSASRFGLGTAQDLFPIHASDEVLSRSDFPRKCLNFAQDGGYLAWRFPDRRIFCDTRIAVYGLDFMRGFAMACLGPEEAWEKLIASWQPEAAILSCNARGAPELARRMLANDQWALIYFDGTTAVLVTRIMAHQRLIADREIQKRGLSLVESARMKALCGSVFDGTNPRLVGAARVFEALSRSSDTLAICQALRSTSPHFAALDRMEAIANFRLARFRESEASLAAYLGYLSGRLPSRFRGVRSRASHWAEQQYVRGLLLLGDIHQRLGEPDNAEADRATARVRNSAIYDSFTIARTNTTLPGLSLDQPSGK